MTLANTPTPSGVSTCANLLQAISTSKLLCQQTTLLKHYLINTDDAKNQAYTMAEVDKLSKKLHTELQAMTPTDTVVQAD